MKLLKMTKQTAEYVIVYGEDKGFSMVKIKDIPLTIYHRKFEGKHYDIAEMKTKIEDYTKYAEPIEVSTFYLLDPEEALQICGFEEDYFEKDKNEGKEVI